MEQWSVEGQDTGSGVSKNGDHSRWTAARFYSTAADSFSAHPKSIFPVHNSCQYGPVTVKECCKSSCKNVHFLTDGILQNAFQFLIPCWHVVLQEADDIHPVLENTDSSNKDTVELVVLVAGNGRIQLHHAACSRPVFVIC